MVTASYQAGATTTFTVQATPTNPNEFSGASTIYVYVVDPNNVISTNASITQNGQSDSYLGTFTTSATIAAGTYTGNFQLEICSDVNCANQFPGSPWSEPYTITVLPSAPQ